jgi:pyrimidine deaminase RibD-like protein
MANAHVEIIVQPATPLISWTNPAAVVYGTTLSVTQLNATASVPGTFNYNLEVGTVLSAGTNTLSVAFTPADTTNYTMANAHVEIIVQPATPLITWTNPAAIVYGTTLSVTQLNAAASVPGTFNYNPDVGTVLSAGTNTLSVAFTPADTTNYTMASAHVEIIAQPATPIVMWTNPAAVVYGITLSATQLNATASVPGTFNYNPDVGTVLSAATNILSVAFTPADTTNYTMANAHVEIIVQPATPVVTWTNPAAIVYGTALSVTQLNATANLPGAFQYNPAIGTVLSPGTNLLSVTFIPTDTTNYITATASVTVMVDGGAPPLLSFQRVDNALVLTWSDSSVLQSATEPGGAYQDIPGAAAPYTNNLSSSAKCFFRLRRAP